MYRVVYDYKTRDGFLETKSVVYDELKMAFIFMSALMDRKEVVGKPILERVN